MTRSIFAILLLTFLASCASIAPYRAPASASKASLIVVTDYDDTVKKSNVANKCALIWNSFLRSDYFAGVTSLLGGWEDSKLHVLSNSPKLLGRKIRRDLNTNGLGDASLHLRSFATRGPAHKGGTLRRLADESTAPIILLGDDVEKDPQIYADLQRELGDRLTVYIHRTRLDSPVLPPGQVGYVTTFDVAYEESCRGRFAPETAERLGRQLEAMLGDPKSSDELLPRWGFCPQTPVVDCGRSASPELNAVCQSLTSRIADLCRARAASGARVSKL